MHRRLLVLVGSVLVLLAAPACSDGESTTTTTSTTTTVTTTTTTTDPSAGEDVATAFTWVTTWDLDGVGYVLTVEGAVGADDASYTMQVEPLLGGGDTGADLAARTAGAAVNGLAARGADLENIDPDGATEVLVDGEDRWYRSPWLIEEAAFAMNGAEWVHVSGDIDFVADISRHVLVERYDEALRTLLELVEAGEGIQAPRAPPDQTELDAILTPWIGLAGPGDPDGAPAVVTGNAGEGTVTWEQTITDEPDGAAGVFAGEVTWVPATAERAAPQPPAPASVIDLEALAEALSQAG